MCCADCYMDACTRNTALDSGSNQAAHATSCIMVARCVKGTQNSNWSTHDTIDRRVYCPGKYLGISARDSMKPSTVSGSSYLRLL